MSNQFYDFIEWIGVGLNLLFVIYIILEHRVGWIFGIIGSFISIALFVHVQLYSEAILYTFYVAMGFYGWRTWNAPPNEKLPIRTKSWQFHVNYILLCILVSIGLGAFFATTTDAQKPYADAFSTIFSFFATYLEAQKILSAWLFWICLNAFSIWLYHERGLLVYAGLMAVYTILSVVGYYRWRKSYVALSGG